MIGLTYGISTYFGDVCHLCRSFCRAKGYVKTLILGFIGISLSFYITSFAISSSPFPFGFRSYRRFVSGHYFCSSYHWWCLRNILKMTKLEHCNGNIDVTCCNWNVYIYTYPSVLVSTFQWSLSFQIVSVFFIFIPMSLIFLIPKPINKNKKVYTPRNISDVIKTAFKDKSYQFLILGFLCVVFMLL